MKSKFLYWGLGVFGVLVAIILVYVSKYREARRMEEDFASILKGLPEGVFTLEEILPFEWDILYFVHPYVDEEEVLKITGVKGVSGFVNEGGMSFVFLKDKKKVLQVFGYPENLGFDFRYGIFRMESGNNKTMRLVEKITYGENTKFRLKKEKELIVLERTGSIPTLEEAVSMGEADLLDVLKGVKEEELLAEWGRYNSEFSGMYGYIWIRKGKKIGAYFDFEKKEVVDVKILE